MTVLVFGGSSQIGHFLLPRLVADNTEVIAISRVSRPPAAGVQWWQGQLPDAVPALPSLRAIVSFGPLQPFAEWLAQASVQGTPRIVATSSMSAQTKRESRVPAERDISRQLREGETALANACAAKGCDWTVLRPTLVYGAGLDKSLTPIAQRAMRQRIFPLPPGGGLRQPVHADDIAQAVIAALACPASAGRILSLGGGERLPAREMFSRVHDSLPIGTLRLSLPSWLLPLGRQCFPRLRGPLDRLDADLIADNTELEHLLGVYPRPFRPVADYWTVPV